MRLFALSVAILSSIMGCSRKDSAMVDIPVSTPIETVPSAMAPSVSTGTPPIILPKGRQYDIVETARGPLEITPLTHAAIWLTYQGKSIFVDPTSESHWDKQPKADYVLITHAHPDHLDTKTLEQISTPKTIWIAPPAVITTLGHGQPITNGETKDFPEFKLEAVPAYNIVRGPSAGYLYHPKGWGNGYVLTVGLKRLYISGDTECTPEVRALKNIDIAFLCMRLPYTMSTSEAVGCLLSFQPKIVYPYHYKGSVLDEVSEKLNNSGIEVRLRDWYPAH